MKAVFLDRDGVINRKIENGYVLEWKDFEFLPDIEGAIKLLNEKMIPVIVVTNQACVGRGLISLDKLNDINGRMMRELMQKGAKIDDVFVCPHKPEDNCDCRKPKTGLFKQAAKKYKIDFKGSWFIGDSDSDVQAGTAMGLKTYLLGKNENIKAVVSNILRELK